MSRKNKQGVGVCCLCGAIDRLSYEHVPPQAAYNHESVIEYEWESILTEREGKGRRRQGGIGAYTLCKVCNSNTGAWYGQEYVKWARTGQSILQRWVASGITEGSFTILNVYPLRFLKQTVTMFFSLIGQYSGAVFSANHPQLMQFVLDKQSQELPLGFRFWMNFYPFNTTGPTSLRRMMPSARIKFVYAPDGSPIGVESAAIFEEIAHPPFALYMTTQDRVFPDAQEITGFKQYGYGEEVNVPLQFKVMNSASPFPGT